MDNPFICEFCGGTTIPAWDPKKKGKDREIWVCEEPSCRKVQT